MSKAGELNSHALVQFTRRTKVWGLLLFIAFAGNVLVANVAWIVVRLVQ